MLLVNQLNGFNARSAGQKLSYRNSSTNTGNLTTYTFSAFDIGEPDPGRYVVVAVGYSDSGSNSISSVTVGGQACSSVGSQNPSATIGHGCALWISDAPVISGETADVVVTLSAGGLDCTISVWAVYDLASTTPTGASSVTETDPSETISTSAGGVAIAVAINGQNASSATWTNLDENYDANIDANRTYSVASIETAAGGLVAFTCNFAASENDRAVFAAWG